LKIGPRDIREKKKPQEVDGDAKKNRKSPVGGVFERSSKR